MIAYTTSAQAILRAKIARLERLLDELDKHDHEMRRLRSALVILRKGVPANDT
jgi:hypothetical protein